MKHRQSGTWSRTCVCGWTIALKWNEWKHNGMLADDRKCPKCDRDGIQDQWNTVPEHYLAILDD